MWSLSRLAHTFFGSRLRSPEECQLLRTIAFEPEKIALYLEYAQWLKDRGDPWYEFIEVDIELNAISAEEEGYSALNERWSQLYSELATKRYRGLKSLGLQPYMAGLLVPYAWMKRGVISEVVIDREGILPDRVEQLFRAAPALQKIEFQGNGLVRSLIGSRIVDYHPDFSRIFSLPQFEQISTLRFDNLFLTAQDLRALAESPHLSNLGQLSIDVVDPEADSSILQHLATSKTTLKQLRLLDLGRCRIDDDTLIAFVNSNDLGELEEFRVDGKELTLPAIVALSASPKLSKLRILEYCNSTIGPEGAISIAESPILGNLQEIKLEHALIGPEGMDALARSTNGAHLKTLRLSDNGLGTRGTEALARSTHWDLLEVLDLSVNDIDSDGAAALASSNCLNKVRELNLFHNPLGSMGAVALAESTQMSVLSELNLYECEIGPEGVQALADAEWMTHVTKLQLDNNEIGPEGVKALIGSTRFSKLESLTLNRVGELPDNLKADLTDRFGDSVRFD